MALDFKISLTLQKHFKIVIDLRTVKISRYKQTPEKIKGRSQEHMNAWGN